MEINFTNTQVQKGPRLYLHCSHISGAGDLRKYAHGRQLLRKAGLNLAESISEKRKGQIVLSIRSDATLRKYLNLATLQLVASKPIFRQLDENNVQVKKNEQNHKVGYP